MKDLASKIVDSLSVIEEVLRNHKRTVLFFTGDKETTVLLELVKGKNIPVVFVDTGSCPQEICEYLKTAERQWAFAARRIGYDTPKEQVSEKENSRSYLREELFFGHLREDGIEVVIHPSKAASKMEKVDGMTVVFPLRDFTDLEIWRFVRANNLPYCRLYDRGWKNIGGALRLTQKETIADEDAQEVARRLEDLGYM